MQLQGANMPPLLSTGASSQLEPLMQARLPADGDLASSVLDGAPLRLGDGSWQAQVALGHSRLYLVPLDTAPALQVCAVGT